MFFLLFALIKVYYCNLSLYSYIFLNPLETNHAVPMLKVYVILLAGINFILYKVKYKNLKVFRGF